MVLKERTSSKLLSALFDLFDKHWCQLVVVKLRSMGCAKAVSLEVHSVMTWPLHLLANSCCSRWLSSVQSSRWRHIDVSAANPQAACGWHVDGM